MAPVPEEVRWLACRASMLSQTSPWLERKLWDASREQETEAFFRLRWEGGMQTSESSKWAER